MPPTSRCSASGSARAPLRGTTRGVLSALALALALAALLPAGARAQTAAGGAPVDTGVAADRFVPAPGRSSILGVEGATVPGALGARATISLGWVARPLTLENRFTGEVWSRPVSGALTLDATVELGLTDRLVVGVGAPIGLVLQGDRLAGLGVLPDGERPLGAGLLGDLRLRAKAQVYRHGELFRLALMALATVPGGGEQDFYATSGPTFEPRLLADLTTRRVGVAALFGWRFAPVRRLFDARLQHEPHAGLGLWLRLPAGERAGALRLLGELEWSGALELRVGVGWLRGRFGVDLGAGVGLGHAPTTPAGRAFLVLRFATEER